MAEWHGYFVVVRASLANQNNWDNLLALFDNLGPANAVLPAHLNHSRTRTDGDARIYEAQFDSEEVSQDAFKQALADEFSVSVDDIHVNASTASHGSGTTAVWDYRYPGAGGAIRFTIHRFGTGAASQEQSGDECRAYWLSDKAAWNGV